VPDRWKTVGRPGVFEIVERGLAEDGGGVGDEDGEKEF